MILSRRPNDFTHRNLFLQVLLGLLASGDKLERLLAVASDEALEPDDPAVLVFLGATAVHASVRRLVASIEPAPLEPEEPTQPHELRGLLR